MTSSPEVKFVERLCAALNAQVRGELTEFASKGASQPSPLDAEIAEDALDVSGQQEKFWREYSRL